MDMHETVTGLDLIASATDNGAAMRVAAAQAKAHAMAMWSLTPSELTDVLNALLNRVAQAVASHRGNVNERIVYTRSWTARVRETLTRLNALSETGTDDYNKLLDDLRLHVAALASQVPASVQGIDSESGKRVRNDTESDFLRGFRSLGAQGMRLAPAWLPQSERDALAQLNTARQEREAAQTERNRKRLTDAVTAAKAAAEAADATDATKAAYEQAQALLDAFNRSHPLAITGESGK